MKVFIIAALTADGFMGRDEKHLSLDWRSKDDAELFIRLTKEAGAMVMGSKTFKTFRVKRVPPGRRLIVYTRHPETITTEGVEVTAEEPQALIERLKKEGVQGLAVCGGAMINKYFIENGVVDEVYLTVEPVFFGQGVTLFSESVEARLTLLDVSKLNGNTVLLHYAVKR